MIEEGHASPEIVSTRTEREPLTKPFDAVVVHGFGVKQSKDGRYELELDGKMRIAAAAQLIITGTADNIILSGAKTSKGEGVPSEAEAMEDYLNRLLNIERRLLVDELKNTDEESDRRSILNQLSRLTTDGQSVDQLLTQESIDLETRMRQIDEKGEGKQQLDNLKLQQKRLEKSREAGAGTNNIQRISITKEEESIDTATNIQETFKRIRDNNWERVLYLTNRYHTRRVHKLIGILKKEEKISLEEVDTLVVPDAEETLRERKSWLRENNATSSPSDYEGLIERFYSSPKTKLKQTLEGVYRILLSVDPDARIATFFAKMFRQQHPESDVPAADDAEE